MQKLSQVEFFKACDYVRNNEAALKGGTPGAIVKSVNQSTGIRITRHHLRRIQEATGIDWLVDSPKRREIRQSEALRILASSVADLYHKSGAKAPDDVAQLAAEGFTLEGGNEQ